MSKRWVGYELPNLVGVIVRIHCVFTLLFENSVHNNVKSREKVKLYRMRGLRIVVFVITVKQWWRDTLPDASATNMELTLLSQNICWANWNGVGAVYVSILHSLLGVWRIKSEYFNI